MVKDENVRFLYRASQDDIKIIKPAGGNERVPLLPKNRSELASNVDRGWAWMVLLGSCFCGAISLGVSSNIGVIYVDIQNSLGVTIVDTSLIGSIQTGTLFISITFASPMAHRIGCRIIALCGSIVIFVGHLVTYFFPSLYVYYAFLGFIAGLGFSFSFSAAINALNEYFVKKRSVAFLVLLGLSGTGILGFGPLISFLLDNLGLRGTLLLLAVVGLNTAVGAMLFFPQRHNNKNTESHHENKCEICSVYLDKELWKIPMMYFMVLSSFMLGFGYIISYTFLPGYIVSRGFSMDIASLSITAIGTTTTAVRLVLGCITNTFPFLNRWIYVLAGVLGGTTLFIIPLCQSATHFLTVAGMFGIFYGTLVGLQPVLLAEFIGSSKFSVSFGATMMVFGVASLIGSPIAGTVAERIPVSGIEYILSGLSYIMSGLFLVPMLFNRFHKGRAKQYSYVEETYFLEENKPLLKREYDKKISVGNQTFVSKF